MRCLIQWFLDFFAIFGVFIYRFLKIYLSYRQNRTHHCYCCLIPVFLVYRLLLYDQYFFRNRPSNMRNRSIFLCFHGIKKNQFKLMIFWYIKEPSWPEGSYFKYISRSTFSTYVEWNNWCSENQSTKKAIVISRWLALPSFFLHHSIEKENTWLVGSIFEMDNRTEPTIVLHQSIDKI